MFRVYCLAKYIWNKRWELTPEKGITWNDWFTNHAGITLDSFAEWARENNLRERWKKEVKQSGYKKRLRKRLNDN